MTAIEALRSIDSLPAVRSAALHFNRGKRAVRPYASLIARVLLVSTFVEDALRTIFEYQAQVMFFRRELHIPKFLALILITVSTSVTLAGVTMVFRKKWEKRGAQLLLGAVAFQQLIYGRHSPITSGNAGFLVRNLCLAGTLCLLMTSHRVKDGLPALPGIPDGGSKDSIRDNIALASRLLFGLLSLEMFDVIGWIWGVVVVPVTFAVLVGYKTDFMGLLLMCFYTFATFTSKQFWMIDTHNARAVYLRDVMRFEFLQTISIMGGLTMLIMHGPGEISVDHKVKRGKAW